MSLSTNLSASTNNGGALRFVDFSSAQIDAQTDWRNAFFDTSVIVPDSMRAQIGQPCLLDRFYQNPEPLSDEKFFGQWRGWLTLDPGWDDRSWPILASPEYHKVPLIPPPAGCTWHTDPIATDAN
ncbi:hypothetical protein [Shimia abyssi]|uniref:hypothetical protein n=1 Tax=Shimia abyssi TaxID=1662395 RepID=UPI001FAFE330|nr:hypothetical protein [Shimia abyssi]